MKNRIAELDVLRGIAIFLVVLGHTVQFLMPTSVNFFSNFLFKFIYSFHMPLFMLLSGYLFYNSVEKDKDLFHFTCVRFRKYLVPAIFFTVLLSILRYVFKYEAIGIIYWFLFAIFAFNLIFKIVHILFKDSIIVYFIILILTYLVPFNSPQVCLSMYQFFLIGYFANKFNFKLKLKTLPPILLIFIISLYFYDNATYVYVSGNYILNSNYSMLSIILIRLLAGVSGSIIMYFLSTFLLRIKFLSNWLIKFGINSLYLYIIHIAIFDVYKLIFGYSLSYQIIMYEFTSIIIASFVIMASLYLCLFFKRMRIWKTIFYIK